jgi:hypothetical protein
LLLLVLHLLMQSSRLWLWLFLTNTRFSQSEFIVPFWKLTKRFSQPFSVGVRFKMRYWKWRCCWNLVAYWCAEIPLHLNNSSNFWHLKSSCNFCLHWCLKVLYHLMVMSINCAYCCITLWKLYFNYSLFPDSYILFLYYLITAAYWSNMHIGKTSVSVQFKRDNTNSKNYIICHMLKNQRLWFFFELGITFF